MFFDIFKFNTLDLIKPIKTPIFFINSGKDEIGDLNVSKEGFSLSMNPKNERVVIKNANHFFSGNDKVLDNLIDLIQTWQFDLLKSLQG